MGERIKQLIVNISKDERVDAAKLLALSLFSTQKDASGSVLL